VIELSADFTIVQWNPGAAAMFGYSQDEAEGQPMNALLVSSRSLDRMATLWSEINTNRKSLQFIVENRRKDGALLQCEWITTPLIDADGGIIGLIALIQNVTQRLENERIKQEFVSIVSHELRTPVTSIKGSLALLSSGVLADDPPRQTELMTLALANTDRLHALINDILDVEKLESGRMDYKFVSGDLRSLMLQVISANEPVALQAGITLQCKLPESSCLATIDPDRIFQVITNILANAIKFSRPASSVTLSLTTDGKTACLGIRNFGEVIPDSDRGKLFTKFFQRDSSATRAKGGTGLGLYICQKILAEHKSRLDFTSSEEDGTFFFFHLPLKNS
jgi:PAS domain S-box-containing protein